MIPDEMIHLIPKEKLIRLFRKELEVARNAKPFPHLVYRDTYSFTKQILTGSIFPKELGATPNELFSLEYTGAELAIMTLLDLALNGDLLLENIPYLISRAYNAMRRYQRTLEEFRVEKEQLENRERAYWYTQGMFFADRLCASKNRSGRTASHVWYLHEIRLAKEKGHFEKSDFYFDQDLHLSIVRQIHNELEALLTIILALPESRSRRAFSQQYNTLRMIAENDLEEFKSELGVQ